MEVVSSLPRTATPPPVLFDLDVAESVRFRNAYIVANGGRLLMVGAAFSVGFQSLLPILRLYRYRGHDPMDWALLSVVLVAFAAALTAVARPKTWQRLFVRGQVGTVVTFEDLGITVERGAPRRRHTMRIALSKIRSVRRTPEALFVFGRSQPIVTIPLRALPNDGEQVMSYFEKRLVATRMLRLSSLRTTIVNTVWP